MRRPTAIGLLASFVAACGGGDSAAPIPPAVVGKRVVFVANTREPYPEPAGELWVTDTAGTEGSPELMYALATSSTLQLDAPFITNGGDWFGVRQPSGTLFAPACPASMYIVETTSGVPTQFLSDPGTCVHEFAFTPIANEMAMRLSLPGGTGAKFAGTTVDAFPNSIYAMDSVPGGNSGTVARFAFTHDGEYPVWTEASGLYSSPAFGIGSGPNQRSSDVPSSFAMGRIGAVHYAVYVAPGTTRFRITNMTPSVAVPQSQAFLTNALPGGGDAIGAYAVSPDGAHLLYEAQIGGDWQLWLVPLAAPLTEVQVDATAPYPTSSQTVSTLGSRSRFAFNTNGGRFAWVGDAGASDLRVYAADVSAPTTATALTPAGLFPYQFLAWADTTTVVFGENAVSSGGGYETDLRVVSVLSPLTTDLITPSPFAGDEAMGAIAMDVCSDGTVVYLTYQAIGGTGPSWQYTTLRAADPANPTGQHKITPTYGSMNSPVAGITAFTCD